MENNNQWELDGNCNMCRRALYCTMRNKNGCGPKKRRSQNMDHPLAAALSLIGNRGGNRR